MKRYCLALFLISFLFGISSAQKYDWLDHFGSSGEDVGYAITEADNSIYVSGWFQNTVTFGDFILTSEGDDDIFLLKITHQGVIEWAVRCGGIYEDNVVDIKADNNGHVYLSGSCSEYSDFGHTLLTGYGGADAFICCVDDHGDFQWALSGGSFFDDRAYRLSLSPKGDFLAFTGHYSGTAQFGAFILPSYEGRDAFIARVNPEGSFTWVFYSGSYSDQSGYGIDIDSDGAIYCAGYFFSEYWQIGPTTIYNSSNGYADCCLIKLTSDGDVCFAHSFGGYFDDLPRPLIINQGHLYIGGYHYGPGYYLGIPIHGDIPTRSSFLLKSDLQGNGIWAMDGLSQQNDELIGLSINQNNQIAISGGFEGTMVIGTQTFISHGLYDAYAVFIDDSTGIPTHAKSSGGPGLDIFYSAKINSDTLLVAGFFEDTALFDSTLIHSAGSRDIVMAEINDFNPGFNDERSQMTIQIFPNPCHNVLSIKSNYNVKSTFSIKLLDLKGRIVDHFDNTSIESFSIDVSEYLPGLYLLEIIPKINQPTTFKVVIN